MKSVLFGLAALIAAQAQATSCELSPHAIGARYTISHGATAERLTEQQFELWRRGNQVAHHYPRRQITEVWDHLRNGAIRPVRYFDQFQRGIEYQPGEVRGKQSWADKWQLLSPALLARMAPGELQGTGCQQFQSYYLKEGNHELSVTWLPRLQLVKSYRIRGPRQNSHWQLQTLITDSKAITDRLTTRESYQTTDYTDIGDNESDPFLAQMINQGFVEHGASGMYNARGEALPASHGHRH